MAIAAVPDYLGSDFHTASPGLRFGMFLKIWDSNFAKKTDKVEPLKPAGKLNDNDLATMKSLLARQQAGFKAIAAGGASLQLEALSSSPFTTGLGNEHPLENGFAFLNPYGLPYLPGSGVKGVLRQAARELASGDWGETHGWTNEAITALFGLESQDGDAEQQRGALIFWDVIPQLPGDSLSVEIMTPHQKDYYQQGQPPHDSGSPNPISFLTVPPGSGFTFHVQCHPAMLRRTAPELAAHEQWKPLLLAAFEHAFNWLGFGAKTAVGYGAMMEDAAKKAKRKEQARQQAEAERRSTLSPEELAYEEHQPAIQEFRQAFDQAREGTYQPGQEFDSKRNLFVEKALAWTDARSRLEAAELLKETIKWGVSKKGRNRLKDAVAQLESNQG